MAYTILTVYILFLVVAIPFQCVSSINIEQNNFSPIYTSTVSSIPSTRDSQYADCSTNFVTLEKALFETGNNRFELISAFYPTRETISPFVNVKYNFNISKNDESEIVENDCQNWIWTTSTFYLIESPDVFQFSSLLFVQLDSKIHTLTLNLPTDCFNLTTVCDANTTETKMMELLTRRLKLYSQFNSLENVAVLSDDDAYAVRAVPVNRVQNISQSNSLETYFSFVIVFPFPIMIMFIVVCCKGARLQLRQKLSNARHYPSFAALATTGMLFSFYVVALDCCAIFWAFGPHVGEKENLLLQSGISSTVQSHYVAIGTLTVDAAATLLSCIILLVGLVLEFQLYCCKKRIDTCVDYVFINLLFPIFCCSKLGRGTELPDQSKEKMAWILAATAIAPLVCFGSHIGFVVIAWLADPKHAGGISVIYIFTFFYYYFTLKAFYQLLTDGKTSFFTCCNYNKVPQNCCCSCCCSCLLKFNNRRETMGKLNDTLQNPEKEVELYEKDMSDAHISFWAILMTGLFGILLAGLQVYAIASLVQTTLTEILEDVPSYILSLFHVTVFLLTAVVTYAILTAEEPVERELLKHVVQNFIYYYKKITKGEQPPRPKATDVVQTVGNIVGALAYKQLNSNINTVVDTDDDLLKRQ